MGIQTVTAIKSFNKRLSKKVVDLSSGSAVRALTVFVFIAVFAAVGLNIRTGLHAATPTASIEAESGTSTACAVSDTSASGGAAIKFGGSQCAGLSLSRIPWEGGPQYWSEFSKATASGWTDPNFFPISVFYGKAEPAHVTSLKDAGINLYMGVEHDPTGNPLTNVTNAGVFAMPNQDEWTPAEVGNNSKAVAWFISDECEMGYSGCNGANENAVLAQQTAFVNKVVAYNDGRFKHANFGNGILRTFWASSTMNQHSQLMDSASADKYTYTSPDVANIIDGVHNAPDWPDGVPVARSYSYGWQADQMKRFQAANDLHPVWTFIETAKPYLNEAGAVTITAQQMEGAVWSALIHEARGIAYFQHNNGTGTCSAGYSIVECPGVHATVKAVDAQVQALAPVLNSQSYYNATRVVNGYTYYYYNFNNGTDTMLKTYNGSAYIIAGLGMHCNNTTCTSGTTDSTGSKTFTLPAGVTGTTVTVVGESRTLPVTGGTFTDTFASEYSHHTYRITL